MRLRISEFPTSKAKQSINTIAMGKFSAGIGYFWRTMILLQLITG